MDRMQWSAHLAATAVPALVGTPLDPAAAAVVPGDAQAFIDGFADEFLHRRAVDRPLLGHLLGVVPPGPAPLSTMHGGVEGVSPDVALWWALLTGDPIGALDGLDRLLDASSIGPAPLVGEAEFQRGAIEATTETELGALHALAHHARLGGAATSALLTERCLDAARWHVDTLQPDNGTNHPWAIQVFVELAHADPAYAMPATLHAEGLLHNALVRTGRPDRFSACVLLDASRALAEPPLVAPGQQKT